MYFWFDVDLSDIDLLNVDSLEQRYTHLYLFVSKTSLRRLQDMYSRRPEDIFSATIFRLPRHLEDVLKTCSSLFARCLEDVLEDEKFLRWRRVEDVFKTCLEDQPMFAGMFLKIIVELSDRKKYLSWLQWKDFPCFMFLWQLQTDLSFLKVR